MVPKTIAGFMAAPTTQARYYSYTYTLRCIVEQEGLLSADDAPDTSYYQWVTFMLV
jgi:hypothetical protein